MARPKRSLAPYHSIRYPLTTPAGTPATPSEPQQSACSAAPSSGRTLARSATVASIITSGIAKLTFVRRRRKPARGALTVAAGSAVSMPRAKRPSTPAMSM